MILYKTQKWWLCSEIGQNSIYGVVFIRKILHSHSTIFAPHQTTLLTTMEHAGHAKLYQMWSFRVLFSDDVNFRDCRASVMDGCMDMQHWSDTDGRTEVLQSNTCPIPTLSTTNFTCRRLLLEV
jgi:hypothetical protein